ncbi:MAG: T9SS type A sorting domain-containing protein [Bacteroidota bacterium]
MNFITDNAHQPDFGGGNRDALLCQLSPDGDLLYGTYFGGDGYVGVQSINAKNNQVYITGSASISADIATLGAHQETSDLVSRTAYIAKFTDDGSLDWATYLAGDGPVNIRDSAVDSAGNFYFFGSSKSSNLATPGAFKEDTLPPEFDEETEEFNYYNYIILGKFSHQGNLEWLTYYSPDPNEDLDDNSFGFIPMTNNAITIDSNDDLYVTANAIPDSELSSPTDDGFYATANAHQSQINGGTDIFISKFDSNGNRIWSTYFGGNENDRLPYLKVGEDDQLYLSLIASSNALATSGVIEESLPEENSILAVKFNPIQGSAIWSTYLDIQAISFVACSANSNGNLFLTVQSDNENYSIANTWEDSLETISDLQLIKLSKDASAVEWSTFYNGEIPTSVANVNPIKFSPDNSFYFSGATSSNTEIASEDSFAENRITDEGQFNGFVAKFVPCNEVPHPVLESPQELEDEQTLDDIEMTPIDWSGSTPTYTWYTDEEGTNEISENTPAQNGETYYLGMQIRGCQEVLFPVEIGTLSIADEDFFELAVFPNPSSGKFSIQGSFSEDFSVKVFSQQGKLLHQSDLKPKSTNEYHFDLAKQLSSGIYLLQIESEGKHQVKKLIVE